MAAIGSGGGRQVYECVEGGGGSAGIPPVMPGCFWMVLLATDE